MTTHLTRKRKSHEQSAADRPSTWQAEQAAAVARVRTLLSAPSMTPEALRERIARGQRWEDENGAVRTFSGRR